MNAATRILATLVTGFVLAAGAQILGNLTGPSTAQQEN